MTKILHDPSLDRSPDYNFGKDGTFQVIPTIYAGVGHILAAFAQTTFGRFSGPTLLFSASRRIGDVRTVLRRHTKARHLS